MVRLSWWGWLIHPDGPSGVDLRPILSGAPVIDDAVKHVGVDDIGSGDRDVVGWGGCRWVDEATGVSIIGPKENALRVLRNDLHDQVSSGVIGACLEPVGRLEESRELRVQPQSNMDISVRLDLEAVDSSAHRATAIENMEPPGEINPRQRWTPLALTRAKTELHERNLDPVVCRYRPHPNGREQPQRYK
jgi:hypothetical protein